MKRSEALAPIPIDPLADPVFKALFGTEENKDLLVSFLNAVLDRIGSPRAVMVELVPPRNLRKSSAAKETEVDVRAKDCDGRVFQVEVQLDSGGPLSERMIFGAGQLYASTLGKGESYSELKPVVSIWLLRDRMPGRSRKGAVTEFRYRDTAGGILGAYPVVVLIELKNWSENVSFKEDLEHWLYFFAHGRDLSTDEELPPQIKSEVFMKAVQETRRFNDSWAKRMAYESYMDKIRWNNALKEEAEARRKQDEEQRHLDEERRRQDEEQRRQDEEQRRQDEEQRRQDEILRAAAERTMAEAERLAAEAKEKESALDAKLAAAYRRLVAAGSTQEEAAKLLGFAPSTFPLDSALPKE